MVHLEVSMPLNLDQIFQSLPLPFHFKFGHFKLPYTGTKELYLASVPTALFYYISALQSVVCYLLWKEYLSNPEAVKYLERIDNI